MAVEVFDLERVVEHVIADGGRVRPVGGHAFDVGDFLTPFGNTRAGFISAVGFEDAHPEAPRAVLWRGIEEVGEIGGVVVGADLGGGFGGGAFLECLSCERAGLAFGIKGDAWCPAFSRHAHEVAALAEGFGIGLEFRREKSDVVAGFLELP